MTTPTPAWGRVQRGVVWHLLTVQAAATWPELPVGPAAWCGVDETFVELTDVRPPRGARPCPRCGEAVDQFHSEVTVARAVATARRAGRPVATALHDRLIEDVDLLGSLPTPMEA